MGVENKKAAGAPLIAIEADSGKHSGKRYLFHQESISIGRDEGNDVVIFQDKTASSLHARLSWDGAAWSLEDCGSKNGVFVESKTGICRLSEAISIKPGEPFVVGKTRLHYTLESVEGAASPARPRHVLRVTRQEDCLLWQFEHPNAHNAVYECPWDPSAERWTQRQLDTVLSRTYENSQPADVSGQNSRTALQQLGEHLTAHFLPPRIKAKLEAIANEALVIMHDPDTMAIPWELIYVNNDFLCMRCNLSRQLVSREQSVLTPRSSADKPLKMLMLVDPGSDLPQAQEKAEALFETLSRLEPDARISYIAQNRIERADVLSRLQHTESVYYVGHAEYDEDNPSRSAWLLSSGRITAQDFQRLVRTPRFVFANGCETARHSAQTRKAHGLAGAFIVNGVEHYLGAIAPVSVEGGLLFAQTFFDFLLNGYSIGEAVRLTRLHLTSTLDSGDPVWALYTLYGDPAAVYF